MINRQVVTQGDFLQLDRTHWMMKDLVGWWPLQEGAGITTFDLSHNQNVGTLTNMDQSTDWLLGFKGGKCLDFDGSNDRVDIVANSAFQDLAQGPMTLTCWCRLDSYRSGGQTSYVVNTWDSGGGWTFFCRTSGQENPSFAVYTTGTTGIWYWPVVNTDWHHFIITYDGTSPTTAPICYLDGNTPSTTTGANPTGSLVTDSGHTLSFMGRDFDNNRNQNGGLFDVRLYRRVLTASEAKELYLNPWAPLSTKSKTFLTASAPGIIYNQRQILLKNKMSIQNSRLLIGK